MSILESAFRRPRSPAEPVSDEAARLLEQAEGVEQEGFHTSVPAANEARLAGQDNLDETALPEVEELPMEEFHAGLKLAGEDPRDKDALFRAAKERIERPVVQSIDVQQEKRAEGILQAARILEQAEKRLQEAEQRWSQAETDRMGVESRLEGYATNEEYRTELRQATERASELRKELDRQSAVVKEMRAAYANANKPIQPGKAE